MKKKEDETILLITAAKNEEQIDLPGYPQNEASEDIYNHYKEIKNLDPEDTTKQKTPIVKSKNGTLNETNSDDDYSGEDLDVPGSELDDDEEEVGNEDEENNLYSGADDEED